MKRNLSKAIFSGVCAGIADWTGIDVLIIRALFIISTLMGFGLPIILYIILTIITPPE